MLPSGSRTLGSQVLPADERERRRVAERGGWREREVYVEYAVGKEKSREREWRQVERGDRGRER